MQGDFRPQGHWGGKGTRPGALSPGGSSPQAGIGTKAFGVHPNLSWVWIFGKRGPAVGRAEGSSRTLGVAPLRPHVAEEAQHLVSQLGPLRHHPARVRGSTPREWLVLDIPSFVLTSKHPAHILSSLSAFCVKLLHIKRLLQISKTRNKRQKITQKTDFHKRPPQSRSAARVGWWPHALRLPLAAWPRGQLWLTWQGCLHAHSRCGERTESSSLLSWIPATVRTIRPASPSRRGPAADPRHTSEPSSQWSSARVSKTTQ